MTRFGSFTPRTIWASAKLILSLISQSRVAVQQKEPLALTRLRRHRIGEKGPSTINFCSATTTTHSQEVGSGRDRCSEILALALKQSPIHLYGAAVWIFTDNQLSRRDEMASVQKDRSSITCVSRFMCFATYKHTLAGCWGRWKKIAAGVHTHIHTVAAGPATVLSGVYDERALKMIVNCRVWDWRLGDGIGRCRDKRQLTACFYLNLVILLSESTHNTTLE